MQFKGFKHFLLCLLSTWFCDSVCGSWARPVAWSSCHKGCTCTACLLSGPGNEPLGWTVPWRFSRKPRNSRGGHPRDCAGEPIATPCGGNCHHKLGSSMDARQSVACTRRYIIFVFALKLWNFCLVIQCRYNQGIVFIWCLAVSCVYNDLASVRWQK